MSLRCESDAHNLGIQGGNIFHPRHVCWQALFHTNFVSIPNAKDNS
jgi:hypothetical protein